MFFLSASLHYTSVLPTMSALFYRLPRKPSSIASAVAVVLPAARNACWFMQLDIRKAWTFRGGFFCDVFVCTSLVR